LPELTPDDLKRASREIDLWTSSCMIATAGPDSIAVLIATKREHETLVWRIGVHPDHQRQGHAGHLLTSLSSKAAILGPPRMLAEVPQNLVAARALFEACGWRQEIEYTDFVLARGEPVEPSNLVIPVTLDELIANDAFDPAARRCWDRSPATLINRKKSIRGLAVASDVRIEAYLLFEERRLLALGCADEDRREVWLGLLLRQFGGADPRPALFERAHPGEVPFELLRSCGFEPSTRSLGYVTEPTPG